MKKVVQSTDLAYAIKQIASGDNDTAFKVMKSLANLLLNLVCIFALVIGALICLHESRPEPKFGLYRIDKMEGSAVRVSRYESEKPSFLTVGEWKDGYDPNYKFVEYPIAFRFDDVKEGKVGDYVVKDAHPGDSFQEHITTFSPAKFGDARECWEGYRRLKNLE